MTNQSNPLDSPLALNQGLAAKLADAYPSLRKIVWSTFYVRRTNLEAGMKSASILPLVIMLATNQCRDRISREP